MDWSFRLSLSHWIPTLWAMYESGEIVRIDIRSEILQNNICSEIAYHPQYTAVE